MEYKIKVTLWDQYDRKRDKRPEYEYSESFDLTDKSDAKACLKQVWAELTAGREVRLVQARLDSIDAVDTTDLFDEGAAKSKRRSSQKTK